MKRTLPISRASHKALGKYLTPGKANMKLTVLADNNSLIDCYFLAEPALSFYIEEGGKKILFDAGYSDVFIKNAQKLGIDLCALDCLVLSHGHLDHTWGMEPLIKLYKKHKFKKPVLLAHPGVFEEKTYQGQKIGIKHSIKELSKYFDVQPSAAPVQLTRSLTFLGEIKRTNNFENQTPIERDFVNDDSSLAFHGKNGLTIITACAHAGICNTVEHARKICKVNKVENIIGGFHLLDTSEKQIKKTVSYLKKLKLSKLYPCHCVDLKAKIALSACAPLYDVGVGLQIEFK